MPTDTLTLDELLRQRARLTPTRTFLRFEGDRFTFREVDKRADDFAALLHARGFGRQAKAAILSRNCPDFIAAYLGILRAGGVAVPLNTLLAPDELRYILEDAEALVCFYGPEKADSVEELKRSGRHEFIPLDQAPPTGMTGRRRPDAAASPHDLATLLYTSGTTGHPKGAMLTHRNIVSNAAAGTSALAVSEKDRFIAFLPLSHSFTFTVCVVIPLLVGASVTLLPSVRPFSKVIRRLVFDRITIFVAVPIVYTLLAKKKLPSFFRYLLNIRFCISGASPLPASTLDAFERSFKLPLLEGYGLTEASPVVSVDRLDPALRKRGTVGLPLPGVTVKIVDDEGNEVPAGTPGELLLTGPNVMQGYFKRPEETALTIRDGWLCTGDVAILDGHGYIRIVDRKKDMILVDGLNVYPSEVEEVALAYDGVEDCAMVGIPLEEGRELPVMFIVPCGPRKPNEKELRAYLLRRVAPYKTPKRIIVVDELPRSPTGKVLKKDLRQWPLSR